jgi:ribosomal protein L37AE/L43A
MTMPEILANITTIIAGLKGMTELVKMISSMKESGISISDKAKVLEISKTLQDAEIDTLKLRDELISKEKELQELRIQLEDKSTMIYEAPLYYKMENGQKSNDPYCPKCFDSSGKKIHLVSTYQGVWRCNECRVVYETKDCVPQQIKTYSVMDNW